MFSLSDSQIATMSLYGQISGMLMSTVGAYYGARSQRDNLQFNAEVADLNARMAERNAQSSLQRGQQAASEVSRRAGQLQSRQRVSLAASGVDLGEGSAAEMIASTDVMKEIDMHTAETNAVYEAWGYRVQGMNYQNEASAARATTSGIRATGAAAASLLSAAGGVASSWYQYQKAQNGKVS